MNERTFVRRATRTFLYFTAACIALAVVLAAITWILIAWIGDDPARAQIVQNLENAGKSPWLAVIRYGLYAAVWFNWPRILATYVPNLSPELAQATRRPVTGFIVAYELIFAQNVLSLVL